MEIRKFEFEQRLNFFGLKLEFPDTRVIFGKFLHLKDFPVSFLILPRFGKNKVEKFALKNV